MSLWSEFIDEYKEIPISPYHLQLAFIEYMIDKNIDIDKRAILLVQNDHRIVREFDKMGKV